MNAHHQAGSSETRTVGLSSRRMVLTLVLVALAAVLAGVLTFMVQAAQNRADADERFAALSRRVTQGIVERLRRYEYGLRGARGVVVAAEGHVSRAAFARYATSRQIDREFPGARGFGVIYRVTASQEAAFLAARHGEGTPGFAFKTLTRQEGDRYVITFVEPIERNLEAIGLDIASETARREAAVQAARTSQATLTAPLTLVQASGRASGGLLLLLPIRRTTAGAPVPEVSSEDDPALIGWSYVPLLIEDILSGLDAEEEHFGLSLLDLDQQPSSAFYVTRQDSLVADGPEEQRIAIPLYGRHWEARLRPTAAFMQSLHQSSPLKAALMAALLSGICAALLSTGLQLVDRTRAQRLEQARRAAIVEGSSDAVIVQTLDGTVTDWNDGAARLFGFTREEAQGKSATDLLLPADLVAEDEKIRSTVASGGRVRVFETTRRARDGTLIPVSITASPIHDSDGVVVGSAKILRDVREAKAAEQRMRELNASLEDQVHERTALLDDAMREANEAKSRFLANVSHEIRTPMNAVIGLSHMLARTRLDDDQAGMLTRIRTAGKTLMALLNDVLDLSKIEAGEMTLEMVPFQLEDVIDEVCSLARVSAEQRGIGFSVSMHAASAQPLIGDSTRLAQILLNLLSNAVKFTAQGAVTLDVRAGQPDAAGRLPLSFRVTDTGIGIAEEVQKRLFQPFVQADASTTRKFGGTGLGLSIVRQLVDLLGGTIRLHSAPGAGSSFEVLLTFPLADQTARPPARRAAAQQTGSRSLAGMRVLVVDDNALNREVAERILGSEGAEVHLAIDGSEACELLRLGDGGFNAILMDVQMPVMDGLQATRSIRALPHGQRLPLIGLTAGVSGGERRAALEAGMDTVIGKPFEPAQLIATVASFLHRPQSEAAPPTSGIPDAGTPADWPVIGGIDAALSFRRLQGDRGLLRRMLVSARQMIEANAALSSDAAADDDALRVHAATLHDLKAVAGTLGAQELEACASRAEQALRTGHREAARDAVNALQAVGEPLAQSIAAALASGALQDRAATTTRPGVELDESTLSLLLAQLNGKDLAALSTWRELAGSFRTQLADELADSLDELVESLQFDAAAQQIRRALGVDDGAE